MHGVDEHGKAVLKKRVSRGKLPELFARLPPSLVGMEPAQGRTIGGESLSGWATGRGSGRPELGALARQSDAAKGAPADSGPLPRAKPARAVALHAGGNRHCSSTLMPHRE